MPSTVLGKRTRSSTEATASVSSRAKRRTRAEIFNDENTNPLEVQHSSDTENDESMEIDELSESNSTPSKRRFVDKHLRSTPSKILTPQTPRHRDATSKAPITPRHRVAVSGKPWTPRTPRSGGTPTTLPTVYSQARHLFSRSTEPGQLVGRQEERDELTSFIDGCVASITGGCTYVSGPPGTGKSAMVNEVTAKIEGSCTLKRAYINCMSMKSSKDLYGTLLETFYDGIEILEGDELKTLQGMFVPRRKSSTVYIITLDEIDHILTLDLEMLYKLFEWSLQKSSHLVLIGIANALDLTDRFLPRLKARNLKPKLLPFLPYNATQIKTVVITRLRSLNSPNSATPDYIPFLHPAAIELCSRKVASQTGDLRKAFDICRRAIDLIEAETRQKHEEASKEQALMNSPSNRALGEKINLSSKAATPKPSSQSMAALTAETAPRASISHVTKITSSTFGNGSTQRLKTLNLQQKAALCALVALEKRKRSTHSITSTPSKSHPTAPSIKELYATYCILCTRDAILHPLTSTEFRDVVGGLETLSLISAVDGRNGSFVGLGSATKRGRKGPFGSGVGAGDEKRVGSCVAEKEVAAAVEGLGAGILKSILSGEGLD